ncbi:MAG: caspase family protein [Anaerolineales bacterium]|jgi:hypothetical protein
MARHAILLANLVTRGAPDIKVTKRIARKNLTQISSALKGLGNLSFSTHIILDEVRETSVTQINTEIRGFSNINNADDDLLLFYYFGHGVERNEDLCFVFSDSESDKTSTMLSFNDLVETIEGFNVKNVLYVVDCCYAGVAANQLVMRSKKHNFSIIASTESSEKAYLHKEEMPFGAFSYNFFRNIRNPEASNLPERNITPFSLFTYAESLLRMDGYIQQPYIIDGGLNLFTISTATPVRAIRSRYYIYVPAKSFYTRLFWITGRVRRAGQISIENLYSIVVSERPDEFKTAIIQGNRRTVQVITEKTFTNLVNRVAWLGILEGDEELQLTDTGTYLMGIDGSGSEFNQILIQVIDSKLSEAGTSLEMIESIIEQLLKRKRPPSYSEIYEDIRQFRRFPISLERFKSLMELAGYSGYFRYSSSRTYYPY